MLIAMRRGFAIIALTLWAASVGAQPPCPGDCNGDRGTTQSEFALALRAAFDTAACPAADLDGNGQVTAAELLRVRIAIVAPPAECTVQPTETATTATSPTPTATPSAPTPESTWIPITPLPGGPRQEVGVTALGSDVYVIGGLTETGSTSDEVEVYDTVANEWRNADPIPAPRHHVGVAVLGGFIYSVAGFGDGFSPTTDVYRYDPDDNEWSPVAPLLTARGALAVAELGGMIYATGGSGPSGSVTDHAVYDPVANEWTALEPLPSPRNHLAAVSHGAFVYVIGGRSDGGGNANSAELDRYDPSTNMWEALTPMPTARSGHAAAVIGNHIVVMGGEVNPNNPPTGVFVEVEMYDVATDRWISLDPMAMPRHGIGAATVGELIYVPGGAIRAGFAATDYSDALRILP